MKPARTPPGITTWAMIGATAVFLVIGPMFSPSRAADLQMHPFYLERAAYERDVSGAMVMFSRDIAARRRDGTLVLVNFFRNRPGLRKLVMPDTTLTWLVDTVHSKTSWPQGSIEGTAIANSAINSTVDCSMGDRVTNHALIDGIDTVVVITDLDSGQHAKFWLAPELGC